MEIKPMLAARGSEIDIKRAMKDPDWVGELKLDGSRYVAHFDKDGVHFYSRRNSVKDGKPVEKTGNLPHLNKPVPHLLGTIADGEIVVGGEKSSSNVVTSIMGASPALAIERQKEQGYVVYALFDVLFYKGQDIQKLPYRERRAYRKKVVEEWNNEHVERIRSYKDKEKLVQYATSNGLEGIILKHKESPYWQDSRNKGWWMKLKKESDWDVVITGYDDPERMTTKVDGTVSVNRFFTNGWIGAIRYGAYKNRVLVEIGKTSGMSDLIREKISKDPDKHLGKVITITGQEVLKDAIRHPRFVCFRFDKNARDCKWDDVFGEQKVRYA
jgi:ATP-dependent DNA ligase